jgi:hypothetical protein
MGLTADELAKRARCTHLKDLNPPVGISERVAGQVIRDWMCRAPRILAVYSRPKTCKQFSF